MTRNEAKAKVRELGGRATSSVSSSTDYLVAGSGGGRKRSDAESLGVKVIDEGQFLALLSEAQLGGKRRAAGRDEGGTPNSEKPEKRGKGQGALF